MLAFLDRDGGADVLTRMGPENYHKRRARELRPRKLVDRVQRMAFRVLPDLRTPREGIKVVRNRLASGLLPAPFDGFRILHLSDLHFNLADTAIRSCVELCRSLDCDLCVITGDFGADLETGPASQLQLLLSVISCPVLAVLGDHDEVVLVEKLERIGVRILLNEACVVRRDGAAIYLAGIDEVRHFRSGDIRRATKSVPKNAFSVLLSHSPEIYRAAETAGFDVVLCGHTHGGQVCCPGGLPIFLNSDIPRRLGAGLWRFESLVGYTSRGIGASLLPLRVNCPPEIAIHQLARR